jgi:hypothetical protein
MTNAERFCEAFAHVSHEIMGRRLQPFSLRHRFWLEAMGSPLVMGGAVTAVDLEMVSRVCAIPFSKLNEKVPAMLLRGPGWMAKLGFLWRLWRCAPGREYAAFQDYFLDHGCPPATHGCGGSSGENGKRYEAMPGILALVTAISRGSGWDPETIWALSPGAAEWYLAGIFTHRGVDMRLKSSHDEEFEEGMRRERAAAALAQG